MRCVIQRSGPASVTVDGKVTGAIDRGLVVLAAFAAGDTDAELEWMARKLPALRIFADDEGRLNRSLTEVGGGILLVSQFTLYGDCRKGHRPSFMGSAAPDLAEDLYDRFGGLLRRQWSQVAEGEFGAMMKVELVNDGPVTLVLDREAPPAPGTDP
ncbi:MAG: D-tyrosyl-tRNA(Tyr) deacylase [bacterium]|nr:D-tyrosyl-tRNA(Tyr) deacylase [bacterium]